MSKPETLNKLFGFKCWRSGNTIFYNVRMSVPRSDVPSIIAYHRPNQDLYFHNGLPNQTSAKVNEEISITSTKQTRLFHIRLCILQSRLTSLSKCQMTLVEATSPRQIWRRRREAELGWTNIRSRWRMATRMAGRLKGAVTYASGQEAYRQMRFLLFWRSHLSALQDSWRTFAGPYLDKIEKL